MSPGCEKPEKEHPRGPMRLEARVLALPLAGHRPRTEPATGQDSSDILSSWVGIMQMLKDNEKENKIQ